MVRFATFTAALLTGAFTRCSAQTIEEVALNNGELSTLVSLLTAANLAPSGPLSDPTADLLVFPPVNAAFDALGAEILAKYSEPKWVKHLEDILLFHVSTGSILSSALPEGDTNVTMLNGEIVTVTSDGAGGVTLSYPTADGLGTAAVAIPDIEATNGVAHVIDGVLLPSHVFTTLADAASSGALGTDYSTVTGLVAPVLGSVPAGNFTVLAPSNAAFDALPAGVLTQLTCDANQAALTRVLSYHVFSDIYPSVALSEGTQTVPSLGGDVTVENTGGSISFNGAPVEAADIVFSDAIVHGISEVIVPDDLVLLDCDSEAPTPAPGPTMEQDMDGMPTASPDEDTPTASPGEDTPTASPVEDNNPTAPSPPTSPSPPTGPSPPTAQGDEDTSNAAAFRFSASVLVAFLVAASL